MEDINELLRSIREETNNIKKLEDEVVTLAEANLLIQRLLRKIDDLENEIDYLKSK